jgi:hypothetical protein
MSINSLSVNCLSVNCLSANCGGTFSFHSLSSLFLLSCVSFLFFHFSYFLSLCLFLFNYFCILFSFFSFNLFHFLSFSMFSFLSFSPTFFHLIYFVFKVKQILAGLNCCYIWHTFPTFLSRDCCRNCCFYRRSTATLLDLNESLDNTLKVVYCVVLQYIFKPKSHFCTFWEA